MKYIEEILLAVLVVMLLSTIAHLKGAEHITVKATCWTNSGGNGIPCKLRTGDDRVWLLTTGWTDDYVVSDTYETEAGELMLLLLKKENNAHKRR